MQDKKLPNWKRDLIRKLHADNNNGLKAKSANTLLKAHLDNITFDGEYTYQQLRLLNLEQDLHQLRDNFDEMGHDAILVLANTYIPGLVDMNNWVYRTCRDLEDEDSVALSIALRYHLNTLSWLLDEIELYLTKK